MGNQQYYKKYMKNESEENNNKHHYLKLFFAAFFMMLLLFVVIAVHLFSSVDTAIGENDEGDIKESGLGVRHLIDSRLKFIQMEDNDKLPSNQAPNVILQKEEEYSKYNQKSNEGEVQTQVFGGQNYSNPYGNNNTYSKSQINFPEPQTIKHPTGIQQAPVTTTTTIKPTIYKVYIGSYSTLEQARVAQSIIQDANLGVTSFVKTLSNGSYTIQVGSYSDAIKATNLSNELRRNHFPARLVQE